MDEASSKTLKTLHIEKCGLWREKPANTLPEVVLHTQKALHAFEHMGLTDASIKWGFSTHFLRCQVLHAPGHLVGTGNQVFKCQLLLGQLAGVEGIVHARWATCPEVFPQVPLWRVFHQHIERSCKQEHIRIQRRNSSPPKAHPGCSGQPVSSYTEGTVKTKLPTALWAALLHTVLCAGTKEVNDVFMLPNHFHHFHLRDQVRKVFVRGIIWGKQEWKAKMSGGK